MEVQVVFHKTTEGFSSLIELDVGDDDDLDGLELKIFFLQLPKCWEYR